MPADPKPRPFDAAVRFSLREVMVVSTVLAVLAFVGGRYYRAQSARAQDALTAYWFASGVITAVVVLHHHRRHWRLRQPASEAYFVLSLAPRRLWNRKWRAAVHFALLTLVLAYFGALSSEVVRFANTTGFGSPRLASRALPAGICIGGTLYAMLRRPVFITDQGVTTGGKFTAWSAVRSAEWAWSRTDTVRFQGDFPKSSSELYATVAREQRALLEAFLRQRTTFIGRSALATGAPTPT